MRESPNAANPVEQIIELRRKPRERVNAALNFLFALEPDRFVYDVRGWRDPLIGSS